MKNIYLQDVQQENCDFISNCHWIERDIAVHLWKQSRLQGAAKKLYKAQWNIIKADIYIFTDDYQIFKAAL